MTEAAGARVDGAPHPAPFAADPGASAGSDHLSVTTGLPGDGFPGDGVPGDEVPDAGSGSAGARTAIRRGVRLVLGVCVAVGVGQGAAWAFTSPGVPYQVLADGRYGALPTTSTYHFVGVAIFALSGIAIGILVAIGAWQLRSARGWQMVLAVVGGSLLGAVIAWSVGRWLAPGTDPASVGATAADAIVVAPPSTGTLLVVLAQPAFAAAVYTFLVAWNGHPDLGRGSGEATPPRD